MAESYKSVICSIFLGKPNSLSVLCYNLLTFRWPALQTAHYPPTLAANDPHTECTHTHTCKQGEQGHTSYKCIKSTKCIREHFHMYTLAHNDSYSGCNGLMKGKKWKESGMRKILWREKVDGMELCAERLSRFL